MKTLLESITKSKLLDSDESSLESLFFIFKTYYEKNDRHKYSEVSRIIYSLGDSEIDVLAVNLNLIADFAKKKDEENIIHKINKLIDHTDLAHYQRKYIEDKVKEKDILIRGLNQSVKMTRRKLMESMEDINRTNKLLDDNYEKVVSEIDDHKSSVYTQFVTILGIFTAIIFGVFGGMEILGNVFSNISTVKISKLLIFSSLIIGAIFTIIYMLLIGIANITKSSLRNCRCGEGDDCKHGPFEKHPIYSTGMAVSLYLLLIGVLSHGYETKNLKGIAFLDALMVNGSGIFIISFVLFIVIMLVFLLMNKMMTKK